MISNIPQKFKEIVKLIFSGYTLQGETFYEILSSFGNLYGIHGETVNEILYKILQTDGVSVTLNDTTYNYLCQLVYLLSERHILNDKITSKYIILDELYELYEALAVPLNFTAEDNNSTVKLKMNGTLDTSYEYSRDNITWSPYTIGDTVTLANVGDKVYFRGDNSSASFSSVNYMQFEVSGNIAASGNIMSILDKTMESTTVPNYGMYQLFSLCYNLTKAPKLPAINLTPSCYKYMFQNCINLTEAPELPATTLSAWCYQYMFQGCTSLTTVPALTATTLASRSYMGMFKDCTALTELTVYANDITANQCLYWLDGTASGTTGILHSLGSADFTGQIPSNWSISH